MDVKYPHIQVKLIGEDGNAYSIIGRVTKAMRRDDCTEEQIQEYITEATSGDYDHLLQVTMATVAEEENDDDEEDYDFSDLNDYDDALDLDYDEDDSDYFDDEDELEAEEEHWLINAWETEVRTSFKNEE